jgi:hypothetical protein
MNFDLSKILESKREYRGRLADLPIEEKLRILDALREREMEIHPDILQRRIALDREGAGWKNWQPRGPK